MCIAVNSFAQKELNRPEHDQLPYYFGLTFGYANMSLHTSKSNRFLQYDSVLTVEPGHSGGVALGLLATMKLMNHWELRAAPQLIIGGAKYFTYTLKYPNALEADTVKKTLPSTLLSLPLQIKFNSDRIDNFRDVHSSVTLLNRARVCPDLHPYFADGVDNARFEVGAYEGR